ncbi:tripartite tricarboxylate transporter permease [Jiangella asiatica]|uniref:Tripartite tricarboxylate transporter permease n=1 Tax=Jiangella asiatica TaxID=2530372 RepID=A0A4R5CRF6_9ACTN|nr:tripartite tricarboxylate transporter permease [Jiangella asiatica]TDE03129.1 tripartite tricarboxylate transporter permease [Jiangella asiatica]
MDALSSLVDGFAVALQPGNLLFALIGCVLGMVVGVLPGIGPIAGIAILLPLTFYLDPTGSIIMLAAIYYGAMYGGTITTVLLNVPGEGSSAITAIDGYKMAQQGRAASALGIAAIGSFVGGIAATVLLVLAAPPLAEVALDFGPPELFALLFLGLTLLVGLGSRSVWLSMLSGVLGLAFVVPGTDAVTGTPRLTFGSVELLDGLDFVPIIMGLFGLSEILYRAHQKRSDVGTTRSASAGVSRRDLKESAGAIARGSAIGSALGVVPGIGTTAPTLMSYALERRISRTPERFGRGAIQGVAGPETTNNAYVSSSMIPLFTLGIPASPTIAILLGAFLINGLTPGPALFTEEPELVWGVIASLFVGNLILLVLNLPLIRVWVLILKIPEPILFPLIMAFMVLGSYTVSRSIFDVWVLIAFGLLGYAAKLLDFPVVPIALTIILGPLLEKALRQSLQMSGGDADVFVRSPIATVLLVAAGLVLLSPLPRRLYRLFRRPDHHRPDDRQPTAPPS